MRIRNVLASAILLFASPVLAAQSFSLTSTATGSANPPIIVVSSPSEFIQNGDFRLSPINVSPFPNAPTVRNLGDATEEWSDWHHVLSTLPEFGNLGTAPAQSIDIQSATLTLAIRTGGDTPNDDELVFEGAPNTYTLGLGQFSLYTRTYDLLSIFGESTIINAFQDDGQIQFRVGNDSLVYNSVLEIHGSILPEPVSMTLTLGAGALLVRRVRRH